MGWKLCAAACLLVSTSAAVAAGSVMADPVKRNHFCHGYFPILTEWQQCHDMWPYDGEAGDAAIKAKWTQCESAATSAGKLDEKKLAACLAGQMKS